MSVHCDLWDFAYGLSWRKALAGWHTKAVADIQNRGSYKAKAVGTSPSAARTNCDISPLVFIWFNDLASSQFLFRLFSFSWRTFCPLLLLIHCISICMHPCWSISIVEIRRQTHHTMRVSKLQGQFVGCVPKQSVEYPKVLIMPLGKLIISVLVPGICVCSGETRLDPVYRGHSSSPRLGNLAVLLGSVL